MAKRAPTEADALFAREGSVPPPTFADHTPSVAKGIRMVPDLSLQVIAIDSQLIVRTCHRSGKSKAFARVPPNCYGEQESSDLRVTRRSPCLSSSSLLT